MLGCIPSYPWPWVAGLWASNWIHLRGSRHFVFLGCPHSPTCPLRPLCHKYLLWSGPVHSDPTTHCLSRSNTHCLPCELMFRSFPRLDALGGQGPYCDLFFVQYVCSICDFILNFNFRGAVQEVFLVLWLLSLFSVGVVWNCLCFPF